MFTAESKIAGVLSDMPDLILTQNSKLLFTWNIFIILYKVHLLKLIMKYYFGQI